MHFAEIAIHGYTVGRATAHLCDPRYFNASVPRHFAEDVIEEIDAAEAGGAKVLLVLVDSLGGESGPGLEVFDRLRRFSEETGPVVTYVREAGSTAVFLALAGDVVLMDTAGRFAEHSCWGDQPTRDTWNEYLASLVESRSLTPYWQARSFMVESPPTGERHNAVIIDPAFALDLGWCDLVMDIERARGFAQQVARAGIPAGLPRHEALTARRPFTRTRPALSTAAVVSVSLLTSSQVDKDNLWPNPSSEIAPPAGADTTQPEWANRVNAGAGAYSGSWVREVTAAVLGFWIPVSPGTILYFEAQQKRTSGTGLGGRLTITFYPTLGTFSGGTATNGAYSTSASWTKVSVTSAAAPSGTNAAFIALEAAAGDTVQWDSLLARRVMQPETVASEDITSAISWGTGWSGQTSLYYARRSAGLTCGTIRALSNGTGGWTSIFTLPIGSRPLMNVRQAGMVYDPTANKFYNASFLIDTNGVCSMTYYDDGTSMNATIFAIANTAWIAISFAFPWI